MDLEIGQPEHVRHRVESGFLAARPRRGLHRTLREHGAVLGPVREFDALHGPCKDHAVISGDGAAAQGCETDIATAARASQAIAASCRMRLERNLAARGGSLASINAVPEGASILA